MIRLLYNLLITLLTPLAFPYWIVRSLAKGHSWRSLGEAVGSLPVQTSTTDGDPIWFHAVSVGEVQSSLPLLQRLRDAQPTVPIVVSTGTATGRKMAEDQIAGLVDFIFRAPLDLPWCVSRVFRRLQPRLLLIAETELWPNYFFQASSLGIPVVIVNGRISDRAAPSYRRWRLLFGPVLRCARLILAQSETDRARFVAAGAAPSTTRVGGNLKYDIDIAQGRSKLPVDLDSALSQSDRRLLFIAGSTREGEEEMLVPALRALAETVPDLLAVVAPRHPHRFDEAAKALAAADLPVCRRSRLASVPISRDAAVLVLDSLGELAALYKRADLVFVGGSLNGWGGHNVLEAVIHEKAVVVGPHMQNFRDIASDLLGVGGLVQVQDIEELPETLLGLAADPSRRRKIGAAGKDLLDRKRGAADRAAREAARLYGSSLPTHAPSLTARFGLAVPTAAWAAVARVRRWAYGRGLLTARRLAPPIVSVGNLTAGGTGKTPMVAWLVERLAERGFPAAVLTRGYGRDESHRTQLVLAGEEVDPRLCGDEPAMLAIRFAESAPSTLVAVGADRHAAGRMVADRADSEYLILDDGFQHMQLQRSLDIVLLDSRRPFGNGYTLPLGRLREPVSSLRDADIVMITRSSAGHEYTALYDAIREANPGAKIFRSRTVAKDLVEVGTGRVHQVGDLMGQRVACFCGIGNASAFFRQGRGLGYDIVLERAYRDHHRYSHRDLEELARSAEAAGAEALLTTSKDVMNLGKAALPIPAHALRIDLEVDADEELLDEILALRKA
ncbi:MAG: tetraacyldisaccharide 4'-kinase [Acidobacteriia bacterium]|nr:tetraacyldisaccharide 4'-kinase [Terriglobia bacterium]MYG03889.1 tetraacyldisaccharide 4'-kinase [Terriglobia bacterium]MYK10789.1 tetraacyldisaccharide 4'-kinase [Terriglobia bacterium]